MVFDGEMNDRGPRGRALVADRSEPDELARSSGKGVEEDDEFRRRIS